MSSLTPNTPRPVAPADLSVNGWNGAYLEELYGRWQSDRASVGPEFDAFFQGFDLAISQQEAASVDPTAPLPVTHVAHTKQGRVDSLIYHYRDIGHLAADLDPLGTPRPQPAMLALGSFDLDESDLDTRFDPGTFPLANPAPLRTIIAALEETYCRHIGVEYMHIQDRARRRWLQQRMETVRNAPLFEREDKQRVLRELSEAHGFEDFLHTRYRGKKRFGLDGGETLIPILDEFAERGPESGVKEYTIAMAHRGRLNVLVNILHKSYDQIFTEFEEAWTEDFVEGGGDVKYHRGHSGDFQTTSGQTIRMTISPNPSHLEFANSVVLGRARAKQRIRDDVERVKCVPILIHGDASLPGQGIVAECFNMMRLDGYTVGGSIHVVVNNQIGFTTNPGDGRSGIYCTDLAKMVEAPIFHVNGDDAEACVFAAQVALAYRQEFKNDVVIDLWCYRKYGHNEGDEPTFTQPLMYEKIKTMRPVVELYAERLIAEGAVTEEEYESQRAAIRVSMDDAHGRTQEAPVEPSVRAFGNVWAGLTEAYSDDPVATGVDRRMLEEVSEAFGTVPPGFTAHKKIAKLLEQRRTAVREDKPLDWAMGELLAYGSLLREGNAVRLTGQDVERGTFSHRHAVIFDQKTGAPHDTLNSLSPDQAKMCTHNSPLSEAACVGFEYGYSLGDPHMLVIWEAQFGDFGNGAQVIFDQFIASGESKWRRYSGLVCFLPHGYEGQGPEHSSARIERFLTLCADDDMQVANVTTPAQMFHLLRRQMKRDFRKPLIVATPKSLLRHRGAVSPVEDLVSGRFHHILDDPAVPDPDRIQRLILCSGKIYYDLHEHRTTVGHDESAIVRIEQLFPLRRASMERIFERYNKADEIVWVQEEPKNMGAFRHMQATLREQFDVDVAYVGRETAASPAVASMKVHLQEQQCILVNALGIPSNPVETPAVA